MRPCLEPAPEPKPSVKTVKEPASGLTTSSSDLDSDDDDSDMKVVRFFFLESTVIYKNEEERDGRAYERETNTRER